MDYLYDKVGFYDTLKGVMQGKQPASSIFAPQQAVVDIEKHMLHFLENHDEQRIASPDFAGSAVKGKPALVVSHLISRAPTLLYFGQDVGEDGSEDAGFGKPTRTSIFDYIGVPAHQAWMNNGKFDGGSLSDEQQKLRDYYKSVMALSKHPAVVAGDMQPLSVEGSNQVAAFSRSIGQQQIWVVSNFAGTQTAITIEVPTSTLNDDKQGAFMLLDLLEANQTAMMTITPEKAHISLTLNALSSVVLTTGAHNER
jgi:neopullulanase